MDEVFGNGQNLERKKEFFKNEAIRTLWRSCQEGQNLHFYESEPMKAELRSLTVQQK